MYDMNGDEDMRSRRMLGMVTSLLIKNRFNYDDHYSGKANYNKRTQQNANKITQHYRFRGKNLMRGHQ